MFIVVGVQCCLGEGLMSKVLAALICGMVLGGPVFSEPLLSSHVSADRLLVIATGSREVAFDLAALDALPQEHFETSTIWTEGVIAFSGPSLRSILDAAGVDPEASIKATALNEYSITFTADDLEEDVPIVATRRDGKTFGPRQLGPLWIVYPFDSDVTYRSDLVYARSLWQLTRITANNDAR